MSARPSFGQPARHGLYFDLVDALAEEGCPICRLGLRAVRRLLDSVAYENVNDPGLRATLREAQGFCNRHAWQYVEEQRDGLGTALIYRDALHRLQQALAELPAAELVRPRRGFGLSRLGDNGHEPRRAAARHLAPRARCPACTMLAEAEARYLATLLDHLPDSEFARRFAASEGLCLPHLRQAIIDYEQGPGLEALLAAEEEQLARLDAQLGEYLRKQDYRFVGETPGAEADAPRAAVRKLSGLPGVR